jgi:3'-5' exoribonuclease
VTEKALCPFQDAARAGAQFLRLQLYDKTGTIQAVMWEQAAEGYRCCADVPIVRVRGKVTSYRDQPQLVVEGIWSVDPLQVNLEDFQATSARSRRDMVAELQQLVEELENNYLRALIQSFLDDRQFLVAFANSPAAKAIHHAYIGGLLEHTLETVSICKELARLYPQFIDLDLLLSGAILHDIGKIKEYDAQKINFEVTDMGKLLGHIIIGAQMVAETIKTLEGFPPFLATELLHMIISHHGKREWGSPEPPKTMNAFALHHADYLSAQISHFSQVVVKHRDSGSQWTPFDGKLERSVYLGFLNLDQEDGIKSSGKDMPAQEELI